MRRSPTPDRAAAAAFRLGLSLHRQGRLAEAEGFYRAQIKENPRHFDSLHNLSQLCVQRGDLESARRLVRRALNERPDSAEAHNSCGQILQLLKRIPDACTHYRKALALKPDYAEACNNLGNALLRLGRHQEAVEFYEKALVLRPELAETHINLAGALMTLQRYEKAIEQGRKAIAIRPDLDHAWFHLGISLETTGRLDEARRAYAKALDISPRRARFHLGLVSLKRVGADDPQLAAMEVLAGEMASLPEEEQMHLHFALGKAYGDLDQPERSFRHLLDGNALKRKSIRYDESATLARFERTRTVVTRDLLNEKRGQGDPSPVPVFILGMPRSGSTLVEQILASHPAVFGAGELDDFDEVVTALGGPPGSGEFPEIMPALGSEALRRLGEAYLDRVRPLAPKAARITDKMPANFRYVGLIHLALPNARIIHTHRDPVDACLSCFSKLFTGEQPFSYDLTELGHYYRAYERLMEHWRTLLPEQVLLDVPYEAVVADLEGQARRIVAHCGLDWDAACLAFHQAERPVRTASAMQVRQPIYATSVGRWRGYGNLLDPLLEALALPGRRMPR